MTNYKHFKIEKLDSISPSFCAAKWLMADFYLHTGTTSSCHLPTPDKIDLIAVKTNINRFNNTIEKIEQRSLMLVGEKPAKCSNCWQAEEINPDAISERTMWSYRFKDVDFTKLNLDDTQQPLVVNVSFDTLCNFICSYCDASQSTSWKTDLLKNGPYKRIKGDPRNTYIRLGKTELVDNYDFIFDKFVEYIDSCLPSLQYLNCLGGEPLISPNFWKFIEILSQKDVSHLCLEVTTNLSNEDALVKVLQYRQFFKEIIFNVSVDNASKSGEFLRKGLVWDTFADNINFLLQNNVKIKLLATIPGIALDQIIEFFDWFLALNSNQCTLNLFRVRHPNFQSIQILPDNLKYKYHQILGNWLEKNQNKIAEDLRNQIKNILTILNEKYDKFDNVEVNVLQLSAKEYYKQYAERHKFNIEDTFSKDLSDWIYNKE